MAVILERVVAVEDFYQGVVEEFFLELFPFFEGRENGALEKSKRLEGGRAKVWIEIPDDEWLRLKVELIMFLLETFNQSSFPSLYAVGREYRRQKEARERQGLSEALPLKIEIKASETPKGHILMVGDRPALIVERELPPQAFSDIYEIREYLYNDCLDTSLMQELERVNNELSPSQRLTVY